MKVPTIVNCADGTPHDWYLQGIVTDNGNTTSDRCRKCRVVVINHWNGARTFYNRVTQFASIPSPYEVIMKNTEKYIADEAKSLVQEFRDSIERAEQIGYRTGRLDMFESIFDDVKALKYVHTANGPMVNYDAVLTIVSKHMKIIQSDKEIE